jgi:hypothetical protein
MKTMLMIEDDESINVLANGWCDILGKDYRLLIATTYDQAADLASLNSDIDVVCIDGNLNPKVKKLDTLDLVPLIKAYCPRAFMIATSSQPDWSDELVRAGCDKAMMKRDIVGSPEGLARVFQLAELVSVVK